MKISFFALFFFSLSLFSQNKTDYNTFYEKGNGNQSASYQETISFYQKLDKNFPTIKMQQMGLTDSGEPLHIVIFDAEKSFKYDSTKSKKTVLLINNAIHPGEPDGIDATMQLFRDLALSKIKIPKNTIVVAIPVYNIGGALNRNSTTRVNQDGPEQYGFRGNARNFDLNRDFIKSDTKNTKSFTEIFHQLNPDVFIDNHVSNGADYQYHLTYIMTQHNKLGKVLGDFLNQEMTPAILKDLKNKKVETTPYVNDFQGTPDKGFSQFFESPRYSTGFASLFNTIGFVVETHMLKKYSERVKATYDFMLSTIEFMDKNGVKIKEMRLQNEKQFQSKKPYTLKWEIDSTKAEKNSFLGFEGSIKKSDVTTGNRLFYDKTKPFEKQINFYKEFKSSKNIEIPVAYIIPKGFWTVIDLLKANKINYSQLKKDSLIEVKSYKISDYKTTSSAYEGHYSHRNTKVISNTEKIIFKKGDYIFSTNQKGVKYLLETLEPEAVDSFFNWNFFDTILQQKEGYSDYVFEDLAFQILKEYPQLKSELEQKIKDDSKFANNPEAQLDWIYKHSVYYEKAHLQYPVFSLMN